MADLSGKKFAIVRFDDDSISEIPVEWMVDEEYCLWPKSKNPTYFIKNCIMPTNDERWSRCHVQVETYCDSYKVARCKALDINYSESDSKQEVGKGKRKIFKKRMPDDSSLSSEEELHTRTLPEAPHLINVEELLSTLHNKNDALVLPLNETFVPENVVGNDFFVNEELNADSDTFSQNRVILVEDSTTVPVRSENQLGENAILNKILKLLVEIKLQNLEIMNVVCETNQTNKAMQDKFLQIEASIPINNTETFDALSEKLKSPEEVELFKSYIKTIGGACPKDYVHRALGKFIANELAVKCSWLGLRSNKRMMGTPIMELIKDVVMSVFKNLTLKDFEHLCSEWFRHAGQRLRRQKD